MKDYSGWLPSRFSSRVALYSISFVFVFFFVWGLWNNLAPSQENGTLREWFTDTYWILPLVGGIYGLVTSKRWGGLSSVFGKAILYFSIGLLMQVFGQVVYSAYAIFGGVEIPYPSLGDIGFFGSIPLYILGLLQLGQTLRLNKAMHKTSNMVLVTVVIVGLLTLSYTIFLKDYNIDLTVPLQVFFDFGYPLGQSLYVGLVALVYILSVGSLGGKLRYKILFLLFALSSQYLADFLFLFNQNRGIWIEGGISDMMYLTAYFFMGVSLVMLDHDI
ncbi:hypothetical protein KBB12_03320 [Candidatus Woesebacteria bacterium]|nr:hypothetical protein [Candidatus Woesebacteria bacterium]